MFRKAVAENPLGFVLALVLVAVLVVAVAVIADQLRTYPLAETLDRLRPAPAAATDRSRPVPAAATATPSLPGSPTARVTTATTSVEGAATISGRVAWGSAGVGGVRAQLLIGDRLVATAITDRNGEYVMTGLRPGTYNSRIDPASVDRVLYPTWAADRGTVVAVEGRDVRAPTWYLSKEVARVGPAADSASTRPVTFSWLALQGTTVYRVRVFDMGSLSCALPTASTPVVLDQETTETSLSSNTLGRGRYEWTVIASQSVEGRSVTIGITSGARCVEVRV